MKYHYKFTLSEAVLIIVAGVVFFALVIPASGLAGNRSKQVSCMDNMRKCIAAAAGYGEDNDKVLGLKNDDVPYLTLLWSMVNGSKPDNQMHSAGKPRLASFRDIVCPASDVRIPKVKSAAANKFNGFYAVPYMSLGGTVPFADSAENNSKFYDLRNRSAYSNPAGDHTKAKIALDLKKLNDASAAAVFAEAYNIEKFRPTFFYSLGKDANLLDLRHQEKTNMSFADGHVALLERDYFFDLKDSKRILVGNQPGWIYYGESETVEAY